MLLYTSVHTYQLAFKAITEDKNTTIIEVIEKAPVLIENKPFIKTWIILGKSG